MGTTTIRLRYPAQCLSCCQPLDRGIEAHWDPSARTVTCNQCAMGGDPFSLAAPIDGGSPAANLEQLAKPGDLSARSRAFRKGARGEHDVASALATIPQCQVLHSRRFGRGDIDHIVIAASGVWVVDAKNYAGDVTIPFLGTVDQVRVGGRKIDKQCQKLRHQVNAVQGAIDGATRVRGALCFVETVWPLTRRLIRDGDVTIAPPRRLARYIAETKVSLPSLQARMDLAGRLSEAFPAVR